MNSNHQLKDKPAIYFCLHVKVESAIKSEKCNLAKWIYIFCNVNSCSTMTEEKTRKRIIEKCLKRTKFSEVEIEKLLCAYEDTVVCICISTIL